MEKTRGFTPLDALVVRRRSARRRLTGFTLIEVLVASLMLILLLSFIYTLFTRAQDLYTRDSVLGSLEEDTRRVTSQFAEEIRLADHNTSNYFATSVPFYFVANPLPGYIDTNGNGIYEGPPLDTLDNSTGDMEIRFRTVRSYTGGVNQFGNIIVYSSQLRELNSSTRDFETADDGVDNDRNGLIDERAIVRFEVNPITNVEIPGTRRILCERLQKGTLVLKCDSNDVATMKFVLNSLDPHFSAADPNRKLITMIGKVSVECRVNTTP